MKFTLPNQFPTEKEGNVLRFDDHTFIQFYKRKECFKHLVKLEHHLILVILQGTKVIISTEEDFTVYKNEFLFLEKGAYLASEKILEDGEFSSILFSFQDDFLNQFKAEYSQYFTKNENYLTTKMFKMEASPNLEAYIQSLLPYFDNQQKIPRPILGLKINELLLNLLFSDSQNQFNHYLSSLGQVHNLSFKETIEQSIFKNLTIEERAFLSQLSASSFKKKI